MIKEYSDAELKHMVDEYFKDNPEKLKQIIKSADFGLKLAAATVVYYTVNDALTFKQCEGLAADDLIEKYKEDVVKLISNKIIYAQLHNEIVKEEKEDEM